MEEMAGTGWDIFSYIYLIGGSAILLGVGWLTKKLTEFVTAKTDNELLKGVIGRLMGSIDDAVAMVNQTIRKEIERSRAPDSPGGERMTEAERKRMFDAVWDALKKEYGGFSGIFNLVSKIGIGDEEAVRTKIDTMIESSVNRQKKDPK